MNGMEMSVVLKDVTERVRYYARRSGADMLELGKALTEAKELVPHGEWESYVRENTGMEKRNAQYFMQAWKKWGDGGQVQGLTVAQIIALLPATEEETRKIGEAKPVESMSSREIKEALRKVREEEQAKTREAVEAERESGRIQLAKTRDALNLEWRERTKGLEEELKESREAAEAMRKAAEDAESRAKDATEAAIQGAREVSARGSKLEEEARKLRQEVEDRDAMIAEMQEQYDEMQKDLLDARSAMARGDAGRSDGEILSAAAMEDAVRVFIGQAGRIPYMHRSFAVMDGEERERYQACVAEVAEWARKSLEALNAVDGNGGVVL